MQQATSETQGPRHRLRDLLAQRLLEDLLAGPPQGTELLLSTGDALDAASRLGGGAAAARRHGAWRRRGQSAARRGVALEAEEVRPQGGASERGPTRCTGHTHAHLLAPLYDVARSLVSYRNTHTQRTQKIAQNLTWRAVTTASGAANTHRSAKSGRAETTAAQPALGGTLRDCFRMCHQKGHAAATAARVGTQVCPAAVPRAYGTAPAAGPRAQALSG